MTKADRPRLLETYHSQEDAQTLCQQTGSGKSKTGNTHYPRQQKPGNLTHGSPLCWTELGLTETCPESQAEASMKAQSYTKAEWEGSVHGPLLT